MKNIRERGITLIALVITVILLLILGGITLNLALDDGGIIKKATTTGERYKISEYIDRVELSKATVMMKNNGKVTLDKLIEQIYEDKIVPRGNIAKVDETSAHMVTEEGYNFLIKVEEKSEYIGKEKIENLPEKQEGILTITGPEWNSEEHTASVTIKKGEGVAEKLEIEYQINGTNEKGWQKYDGGKIDGLQHGNIIYARLWNGLTGVEYASLQIEDGNKPEATIDLHGTSATVETSVTATVTQTDNESGININNCKWVYTNSADPIGIEEEKIGEYKNSFNESTEELTLESKEAGTYYLHVLSEDYAGNRTETISKNGVIVTSGAMVTYHIDTDNTKQEKVLTGHDCLQADSAKNPTKTGYIFVGWKKDQTANATVETGSVIMENSPIDLYAVFSKQVIVNLYNNNNTTPTVQDGMQYYNNGIITNPTFTLAQAEKTGWTKKGWTEGTDANSGIKYEVLNNTQIADSTTLYGRYDKGITVNLYDNNTKATAKTGTAYYNSNGQTGGGIELTLAQADKTGWTKKGWSEGTEANPTKKYDNNQKVTFTDDANLYGFYDKGITVNLYNNSTTASTNTGTVYYNSSGQTAGGVTLTLNQANKDTWAAKGWSEGTEANPTKKYDNSQKVTFTDDATLYGFYQRTVTVKYNGNGNNSGTTADSTGTAYYNSSGSSSSTGVSLRANSFTKTDYRWIAWAEGGAGGTQRAAGYTYTGTSDITYYAVWQDTGFVIFQADFTIREPSTYKYTTLNENYLGIGTPGAPYTNGCYTHLARGSGQGFCMTNYEIKFGEYKTAEIEFSCYEKKRSSATKVSVGYWKDAYRELEILGQLPENGTATYKFRTSYERANVRLGYEVTNLLEYEIEYGIFIKSIKLYK